MRKGNRANRRTGTRSLTRQQHTPTVGCRSLDILHVAAALVQGATDFCTLDTRQGRLAQLAGFRVQP